MDMFLWWLFCRLIQNLWTICQKMSTYLKTFPVSLNARWQFELNQTTKMNALGFGVRTVPLLFSHRKEVSCQTVTMCCSNWLHSYHMCVYYRYVMSSKCSLVVSIRRISLHNVLITNHYVPFWIKLFYTLPVFLQLCFSSCCCSSIVPKLS